MKYYNYEVTQQQRKDLALLRKEYKDLPYCHNFTEAETIINKYKYRLKGLPVPLTKSQKRLLAQLRSHNVYFPFCDNQKDAIKIIREYADKYDLLHNTRLKGFEGEFTGGCNNPITPKQTLIIESLILCYGEDIVPKMSTSKQAWEFINKYQYLIYKNELGFFIDDQNVEMLKREIKEDEDEFYVVCEDPYDPYDYDGPGDDYFKDYIRSLE